MAKRLGPVSIGVVADLDTKKAQSELDKLTSPKEVEIVPKLVNTTKVFGRMQKILEKPIKQIQDALTFDDLSKQIAGHIKAAEKTVDKGLIPGIEAQLKDFQERFASVEFKLDNGKLVKGYQQAIEQANQLAVATAEQGKIASAAEKSKQKAIEGTVASVEKQTTAIQQQRKESEELAAAQEKLNKTQNQDKKSEPYLASWTGEAVKSFDLLNLKARTLNKELKEIKNTVREAWNDEKTGYGSVFTDNDSGARVGLTYKNGTSATIMDGVVTIFDEFGKEITKELSSFSKTSIDSLLRNIVYAIYEDGYSSIDTQFGDLTAYQPGNGAWQLNESNLRYLEDYHQLVEVLHGDLQAIRSEEKRSEEEKLARQKEIEEYERLILNPDLLEQYYGKEIQLLGQIEEKRNELISMKAPEGEADYYKTDEGNLKYAKQLLDYYTQQKQITQELIVLKKEYNDIPLPSVDKESLTFKGQNKYNLESISTKDFDSRYSIDELSSKYDEEVSFQTKRIEKFSKAIEQTAKVREQEAAATEKVADAQKKLNEASQSQVNNSERINELKKIIKVQNDWIRYLDGSLNADNFKTSGKRQATEQLRALTKSLASKRMNNYADDAWKQYPEEMAEVAWMEAYKEAQRQGVAQSTLTRYDTDAKYSYDRNLKTLQEEYDYRKKILDESKEQLRLLQEVASVEDATGVAQQQERLNVVSKETTKAGEKVQSLSSKIFDALKQIRELENKLRDSNYSNDDAIQKMERIREIYAEISNIDSKQFPYISKAFDDDDFNPQGIAVNFSTTDEMLREMANSIAVYATTSKENLGELKLIKIDTSGAELLNSELKSICDNSGKAVDAYRGLAGELKSNSLLTLEHHSGATWFSTQKDVANGYTRGTDNIYRANLQARRLLDIDANNSSWNDITFLGDGSDDVSKRITELYEKKQELKKESLRLAEANQFESQTYKDLQASLRRVTADYEHYSKSLTNPYGTNDTNWYAKYAKENGYDAVRIRNVYDTLQGGGLSDVIGVFSEEQITNVEKVVDTLQKDVMNQLQNLIGDLKSKYGGESFSNIFGETISSFGELDASNATGLYDALIAKNEEYQKSVEEQTQKTQAAAREMQAFAVQSQELANKYSSNLEFMSKYSDLMNQMSQSTLTAADATRQLNEWIDSSGLAEPIASATQQEQQFQQQISETTGEILEQNKTLKETVDIVKSVFEGYKSSYSADQMKQLLKGANLKDILSGLDVSKSNKAEIENKYSQLASMWADEGNIEESVLSAATQEFVDLVVSSSTRRIENVTQEMKDKAKEFLDYMNGKQFSYSATDKAEFGSDWTAVSKVALGKNQKLLSNKSGTPLTDNRYTEILDVYNKLIGAAQEIDQKQNQLQQIVKMVSNAKDLAGAPLTKSIDLTEEDSAALYDKVSASMSIAVNNAEQMRIAAAESARKEQELAEAAERAAEAKRKQAEATGEASKASSVEINAEEIISRDIEEALEKLRSAKDNETTLINLKGVFSGDDLVDQFSSMVQKIAEQANLSVGKITVKDDAASVQLYNEELKVTVDQVYKLKAATEEANSVQLELTSQSFSQNVKALNENNFDIDGFRARAEAAVEKVRSSLHGLEYDLTDLEKAAGNISSKEDFTKFSNQLKAAQDNIQAIKNATVSKSSMNQLANMQRDMKNANIELETMRIKLQKIGDIDDVADAKKMIDDMAAAAQKFNEAQDAQGQQDAYSTYSESRSSFKAQLEYLNAVKSFNASQESASKQTVSPIKEQYESLLNTINKINSVNSDILKFQEKDAGSGLFSGYIKQLQASKEELVSQLQSTIQEIEASLSQGSVQGKEISIPSVKFLDDNGTVSNFLNDTKTQAALTTEEIDKLVASLQKAQNMDVQAAAKVTEQFRSVQETYQKIGSLFSLDTNSTMYKNVEMLFSSIMKYKQMLSSDPTQWTPEQSKYLQTLIDEFNKYGNVLVQVGQKEQQYFAGKQKYTQDTSMQTMAEDAKKASEEVSSAQQKLTNAAQAFAKESGASGAIITNFTQSADGIAKLDFSVLDSGTNSLRKFSMEMGSVSEGVYVTETTLNNFVSKAQAAAKQLEAVSNLKNMLAQSGLQDSSEFARLESIISRLNAELTKGSGASDTELTRLTKEAKLTASEVDKLYKKWLQMQDAIDSNKAVDLGKIDLNGDVYKQLSDGLKQWADQAGVSNVKIASLNTSTGKFKVTAEGTDNTVRTFTGDLNRLSNTASMQQTNVQDLGTKWERFKTSLAGTGKQFMTALVGYNMFFKAISQIRQGYQYVKEIDLAMTELKKVTDETEASYDNFLKTASKTAGVIGSTVSDFTEATANFARLNI